MKNALMILILSLSSAAAMAAPSALLAKLEGKTITCDVQKSSYKGKVPSELLPISFKIDKKGINANKESFDDSRAQVEISKSWVILTLVSDATISNHYHIQYIVDEMDGSVSLAAGVLDQADDQAGGQENLAIPLSCNLN
jgi:hypothetical protein